MVTKRIEDCILVTFPDSAVKLQIRLLPSNRHHLHERMEELVDRIETVVDGQVVRSEHYDSCVHNIEYFDQGSLVRRDFYTGSGELAAVQIYTSQEILTTYIKPVSPLYGTVSHTTCGTSCTRNTASPSVHDPHRCTHHILLGDSAYAGDIILQGRSQFMQFINSWLISQGDDVIIVDRAVDVIDSLYPVVTSQRLYSIVHADHYDHSQAKDGILLWNNHYENVFSKPHHITGAVVATRRQKDTLEYQLRTGLPCPTAETPSLKDPLPGVQDQSGLDPELSGQHLSQPPTASIPVHCIPVGFSQAPKTVTETKEYTPASVVTASRLAEEKHLDLLILAVIEARHVIPHITLDIYGEGNREGLLSLIEEHGASSYITLKGHQSLEGILGSYSLYASASTSEGFGLTLLEAMSQGLPLIGFDVDYGNREMITPQVNGYLVSYRSQGPSASQRNISALSQALVTCLSNPNLQAFREASLAQAHMYTIDKIETLWRKLLLEDTPTSEGQPDPGGKAS